MYRFIRLYNQNRKEIWKIIGIILVIIFVLQLLNYSAKKKVGNEKQELNHVNNALSYHDLDLATNKSVLSGEEISEHKQDDIKIIDSFFTYCNQQKIQEAYDLLTEQCKEEMYSSLPIFEERYCQEVLNGQKKNITVENWTGNIYKVSINDDFIATGEYSDKNKIQDFITVQDNKLNINSYIGRTVLHTEKQFDDITIKMIQEDSYMDYIQYTFEVSNDSKKAILLDTLENIDTMYIRDSNGVKYTAYSHELSKGNLLVDEGDKKQITIKFYSKFSSTKRIRKMVFSKFILDYNQDLSSEHSTVEIEL